MKHVGGGQGMKAIICDVCSEIVKGNAEPEDFTRTWDEGEVTIHLSEKDRCDDCIRKANAKLAKKAWDCEKQKRQIKKPALKVAA